MKDLPVFTGCCGVATLVLHEIPYRKEAYVLVRSVFTTLEAFLEECENFCKAAGAESVYYGGEGDFSSYPIHASLVERSAAVKNLPATDAAAVAVTAQEEKKWLRLYQERFRTVPAASSCPSMENLYFILKDHSLIGLGQVTENKLCSVASLKPGAGKDCVCALAARCTGETVTLLCAEQNLPAMKLYDRLGFSRGKIKEVWFSKKVLAI